MTQRQCAVLGKPIAHSLSPVLHQAAYGALGMQGWTYGRQEVGEEDLDGFLAGLDERWAGLSLTMPLKKAIMPHGEAANRWARELGVANTAVFDWRQGEAAMRLYNTDVYGIARAFAHAGAAPGAAGSCAIVLGNGNTAASAIAACTMLGMSNVAVAARHPDKNPSLRALAKRLGVASFGVFPLAQAPVLLAGADIAISTIPGLGADPVAQGLLHAGGRLRGALLDVVYDPRPTKLMKAWTRLGGHAIGGQEMLLYQAVAQALLMTGAMPSFDPDDAHAEGGATLEQAMRKALEEAL